MHNLRLLMIEDNEDDALLLLNELRYGGGFNIVDFERVQSLEDLNRALMERPWDIVLSDFNLPGFNGMAALECVQQSSQPDIPFILVSGMIGEEMAVKALKSGAHDYLLKDRLFRLPQAVYGELAKARQRQMLKETQAQLTLAKESAELANQRKSQVLAFVAHEFKNPIQAISLHTEMLQNGMMGELNEKQLAFTQIIATAVNQLKSLVEDILDTAAIEANKIQLNVDWVDLATIIEEARIIVAETARQRGISLYIHISSGIDVIPADPKRLRQIIINLLSNAIKYSPPGEDIILQVQAMPSQKEVAISVIDSGIGITHEELQQLFTEFYRVYNKFNKQTEGVGLGLALTKQLVELHHGRIEVDSQPNVGSKFTIILPMEQPVLQQEESTLVVSSSAS